MARLFGVVGNRTDLLGAVLASETAALRVTSAGVPLGWGIGFYQGGEVLMRRRPSDDRDLLLPHDIAGDIRADMLVGHVRSATVGALRPENTHPFRYGEWLFAQTGTVNAFSDIRARLVESIPEFLRPGIRGESDAEVVFHLFLAFLHDGGKLEQVPAPRACEALRSTYSLINSIGTEVGAPPVALNVIVSNGEYLVGASRAAPMAYRVLAGKADAEALIGDDLHLRRKIPELSQVHFSLLASDFGPVRGSAPPSSASPASVFPPASGELLPPPHWKRAPESNGGSSLFILERDREPKTEAF